MFDEVLLSQHDCFYISTTAPSLYILYCCSWSCCVVFIVLITVFVLCLTAASGSRGTDYIFLLFFLVSNKAILSESELPLLLLHPALLGETIHCCTCPSC